VDHAWAAQADEHAIACGSGDEELPPGWPGVLYRRGLELAVDRDTVQILTANIIQEAAKWAIASSSGAARNAFCGAHPHCASHVVYAPLSEKVARMKLRHPHEQDLQALLRRIDSERLPLCPALLRLRLLRSPALSHHHQ